MKQQENVQKELRFVIVFCFPHTYVSAISSSLEIIPHQTVVLIDQSYDLT